jgi:hypothetical protein
MIYYKCCHINESKHKHGIWSILAIINHIVITIDGLNAGGGTLVTKSKKCMNKNIGCNILVVG